MLEEVDFYEAKSRLPELLRRVEAGEAFTIVNRGKPVADVVPSQARVRVKVEVAITNILKAKKYKVSARALGVFKDGGRK
ncbi:MAG TPA: type II toxin-antitoxin system prevent-host-death family antitoxin [Spongiibacteraceae bacterium]|nr:type II toxin-antitoxin system prevent-host-death family antitoxin [Spongiibacteraceae bacterium]